MQNSLKKAFLRRLEEAGIDPQTVDLSVYDFYSFESVDDLLHFYARHGDPICQKILGDDYGYSAYADRFAHEYKNYLESLEQKTPDEQLEEIQVRLDELEKQLKLLTYNIPNVAIDNIQQQIQQLQTEIMALKQANNHEPLKQLNNTINKIMEKIASLELRLETFTPEPKTQTTLPEYGPQYGPPMEIELIPEPDPDHKPANMKPAKKRNPRITAGLIRVTLIHVIGLFISYIISDMSGVSMLFTFMVFIVIAWLDTLTWLPYHGPSRRGFATGYLYSQYTNPYKAGRGR
ncbi:MAG: hypothetical protein QW186_07935 [Candidatus Bathyarchaeia archaeon]